MCACRNLEQAPGLVDPDVTDDVGCADAGVDVAPAQRGIERKRQIVDVGAVPDHGIVKTDGAGHAIAELRGVLNVVDAGIGVLTAEQKGREIPGETLPWRGIGGCRLAEGEAGELEEDILRRYVAFTRLVQQAGIACRRLAMR